MIQKVIVTCCLMLGIANISVSGDLAGNFEFDASTGYLRSAEQLFQLYGIRVIDRHRQCIANDIPWNCGKAAHQVLLNYLDNGSVVCVLFSNTNNRDAELPKVECFLEARSINAQLVAEGWALTAVGILVPYNDESRVAQQSEAGVFLGGFMPPEEWRPLPPTGLQECGVCTARHQSIVRTREKRKARLQGTGGSN